MRVVDVFCAVSLSRTMRSLTITDQKSSLWRQRKPLACGPKHCQFSQTSNDCLSRFCDTRGSKVPAILRHWQELDTERSCVLSSFHKKSLRETDLEKIAISTNMTTNARKTRHKRASGPRGRPTLCDTISPSERSLCKHRFVVNSGPLNASMICCGRPFF